MSIDAQIHLSARAQQAFRDQYHTQVEALRQEIAIYESLRCGLKKQKIQPYTAIRYAGVILADIQTVADALAVTICQRVVFRALPDELGGDPVSASAGQCALSVWRYRRTAPRRLRAPIAPDGAMRRVSAQRATTAIPACPRQPSGRRDLSAPVATRCRTASSPLAAVPGSPRRVSRRLCTPRGRRPTSWTDGPSGGTGA